MYHRSINISKTNSFFLFGARGTGKTRLLSTLFPPSEALYIDLLSGADYLRYSTNPDEFKSVCLSSKKPWIIVDEIQKAPGLLDTVHQLIESHRLLFALTGSSARKLRRGGANLLAGRAFVRKLFPLTHRELAGDFVLQSALEWGTLPRLFSIPQEEDKARFLDAYALTYIKEEISAEQLVRKLDPFVRFLEIAAQSNTMLVNYSKIADDCGSSAKVVQSYFQILEDTLLGYFLPSYHQSFRKRQRVTPKFYFFDLGVVRALTRTIGQPIAPATFAYGRAFEHFIITELRRLSSYYEKRFSFSYLRTKDDAEIDLIVERPGMPRIALEIKSSPKITERDVSTLERFSKDLTNTECICLCQETHPRRLGTVDIEPWREGIQRVLGI
jgi:predicted AAA+ superfamily ATPase